MVLFHQRTGASLPESALSARLQYSSATLVLAVPLSLAISMERLLSRDRQTFVQAGRPRGSSTSPRPLLDRFSPHLFHLLHYAGILFHALLPCPRSAAWLRHGRGWRLDTARNARALRNRRCRRDRVFRDICCRSKSPDAR